MNDISDIIQTLIDIGNLSSNFYYYAALVLLNLALAATLFIFGVPRAHAQLMRRRSGKGYNKKYKRQLESHGKEVRELPFQWTSPPDLQA